MLIEFGTLIGRNIMSYGSGGFEIDLSSARNTLIRGKSGHGKSALIEALTYCLFGKPYRDVKLAQLINTKNGKGLYTEVNFRCGNDEFKVIRTMKPNDFLIHKNGELILQEGNTADYQKKLETIIGFNYATFKQVCVIGSIEYTQFMKLETPKRRAMIDELLDIKVFTMMSVLAKEANTNLSRAFDSILDRTEQKKSEARRLNNILTSMLENEASKSGELAERLKSAKESLAEKMEISEKIIRQIEKLTSKTAGISELRKKSSDLRTKAIELKSSIKEKQGIVKFFEENPDSCPTCLQHIEESHREFLVNKATTSINKANSKIEVVNEVSEEISEEIEKIETTLEKISELNRLQSEINADIRSLNSQIEHINADMNKTNDSELVRAQIQKTQEECIGLDDERHSIEDELKYAKECVNILKDTGIKARIVKIYIPIINEHINKYLEALDLFVNFELDENFDEKILSRHRDSFTYNSFSNGEQQRIDLAILFTWREIAKRKNSVSTNILFFDETVDKSLDPDTIEFFVSALESLNTNCVIVSHREMQTTYFDRILHVVKGSDDYSVIHDIS